MSPDHLHREADGTVVDDACVPLVTGPDLSALLDSPIADLVFHVEPSVDGDPRPLLPMRQRKLTVAWRDDTSPRVLRLESRNTVTIRLGDTVEETA